MRTPILVSICAIVLIGCGDDSTGSVVPEDANAPDGASAEAGNPADSGAADATSSRDASADAASDANAFANADAPGEPAPNADASQGADASADANSIDAIAPTDAGMLDEPDANGDNTGPCADSGTWDGGFCCGTPSIATAEGPNDCGRCGHSCGGGACNAGLCEPFVVATLPATFTDVFDIAANDSLVFVSGTDSNEVTPVIDSAPLDGGPVQVFARTTDEAYELLAEPSALYWSDGESIASGSVDAGSVTTVVAPDTSAIVGFGADPTGSFLYWSELSSTNNMTVWMDPPDGGAPSDIWDGGNQQCGGVDFAATTSDVYWTYTSNSTGPTVPVLTAPLGSTAFTTTPVSVPDSDQIAVQGDNLFVLSYANGGLIESIPLFDGGAPLFYGDEAGAMAFAVDPSWLYIADEANSLQAFPFDGGSSVVLDNAFEMEPRRFANTPGFIYWVTSGSPMAIMGVATP